MRKILFFLLGVLILRGDVLKDYLNQNYNRVCKFDTIEKYKNNEKLLTNLRYAVREEKTFAQLLEKMKIN